MSNDYALLILDALVNDMTLLDDCPDLDRWAQEHLASLEYLRREIASLDKQ